MSDEKVEIDESTATIAFAWGVAINVGEDIDQETEAALRDLSSVIAPDINIDDLLKALRTGPKGYE